MRILVWMCGIKEPESLFQSWLVAGMEAAGHQVVGLDAYALAAVYGSHGMQRVILEYAKAYRVDVALVLPGNIVETGVCEALKAQGVRLVALRYDDGLQLAPGALYPHPQQVAMGSHLDGLCDLVLTTCKLAPAIFTELNFPTPQYGRLPIAWQTFSAGPESRRSVISFVGQPKRIEGGDSWRIQAVRALLAAGLPLEVYGHGWQDVPGLETIAQPALSMAAMHRVMRTSAVNLCLPGARHPGRHSMLKYRNLEVAACGGMQLTDFCPELADYFDLERDLATYADLDEMVGKARYFLDHEAEAAEMGRRSRVACEAGLGWDAWWVDVAQRLAALGLELDLESASIEPDEASRFGLAAVAMTMGHVHEVRGDAAIAADYFREVLRYFPSDHGALAGLARLAEAPEARLTAWRAAAESAGYTMATQQPGAGYGLPGLGPKTGTGFEIEAAFSWFMHARQQGAMDDMVAALRVISRTMPDFTLRATQQLMADRHFQAAMAAMNDLVELYPQLHAVWRQRGKFLYELGNTEAATGDAVELQRLQHLPPRIIGAETP